MFESTISVDMRNTMKAEAVKCMDILKLDKRCIKAFEKGNVWMSSGLSVVCMRQTTNSRT